MLVCWSAPAQAQSRPLVTEDPETVPAGFVLFEAGLDFAKDAKFPAAGLEGSLKRFGTFGLSLGVSSIAEIQIDGALRDQLRVTAVSAASPFVGTIDVDDTTSTFGDLFVGAKIRLVSETTSRPAFAVRFSTRVPSASTDSGIGTGTMDFYYGIGIAKTVQSVRIAANAGFGKLGDPIVVGENHDVLTYGFSVARAVAQGVEIVGEFNGRSNLGDEVDPIGAETRSVVRVGTRYTRGPVRLDGALMLGITDEDPTWGFTAGLTWVFRAFTVQ
jgi:hypothetical protein